MSTIASFLEKISLSCWTVPKYRRLFFAILTLFILFSYGYYFGTFDQTSHIPFLKKNADSSLFLNDRFFDLRSTHYSYFWLLFIPFYKARVLEFVMFVIHICSIYLTFWAIWELSKTLFKNHLTSLLATIVSAFPHMGFSGFPLFEFSMLNRTVALPFELIAFNLYLKKKYISCFLLLGVLYNFHALSVNFILAMLGIDMLFALFKRRVGNIFLAVPFFLITALPVLIWKFGHSGIQTQINWEWFRILEMSVFFHLFNFFSFTYPFVNILTIGGISSLILFFIAKRWIPQNNIHETVSHFVYGGIFVLAIQLLATLFYPSTIIIQSQVVRIGTFLTLFTYLYMSYAVSVYHKSKNHLVSYVSILLFSFFPFLLLLSLPFWHKKNTKPLQLIAVLITIIFFITLFTLITLNLARPGIYIFPRKTAYYDVQIWAKNNTSQSALFITPPANWWMYDAEWRVISERSTVCTLSELLEAAFDPAYIAYWKPRFEDVAPGVLKQFKGNYLENLKIANEAFYHHSTQDFIQLSKKYKATYLVVDKQHKHNLPVVYQNEEYVVYYLLSTPQVSE